MIGCSDYRNEDLCSNLIETKRTIPFCSTCFLEAHVVYPHQTRLTLFSGSASVSGGTGFSPGPGRAEPAGSEPAPSRVTSHETKPCCFADILQFPTYVAFTLTSLNLQAPTNHEIPKNLVDQTFQWSEPTLMTASSCKAA